jgi:3-hydroxymyristoyl/3-hydroxydecanoyl-(acyl carrier protein) dehydratase
MITPNDVFCFDCREDSDACVGKFTCSDNLPYLEGHFPGQAVMPAVAVIDATCVFLSLVYPDFVIAKVDSAKFSGPVLPGMHVELRAVASPGAWTVTWNHDEHKLAELRLISR